MDLIIIGGIVCGAFLLAALLVAVFLRVVVPTNEVHIVQSSKSTISYGKDCPAGNTYYRWPSWVPKIGLVTVALPVSVFDQDLANYAAYDRGRVPFVVDVKAFFRITDSNVAAQRVSSFNELLEQLRAILQGAIRTILASEDIEEIMQGRSKFGDMFTQEVDSQLKAWGVSTVKNIELMDIRDHDGSHVIKNIMEKKKSLIEKQSRVEVAQNIKEAEIAEIEARQQVDVRAQEALQQVGIRTAEKDKQVGIAQEVSQQEIKDQQRVTTEKDMAVKQVSAVKTAEIVREVEIVKAEQEKRTKVLVAEGALQATKLAAEGIQADGNARAEAEKMMQLAPVEAQISLAKEIGNNQGYQQYLVSIRQVEATQLVGVEQARALEKAGIKVIVNSGDVPNGINKIVDVFTPQGGAQIGSMLETLAQTDAGQSLINKFLGGSVKTADTNSDQKS